jgi:hypothetical protein
MAVRQTSLISPGSADLLLLLFLQAAAGSGFGAEHYWRNLRKKEGVFPLFVVVGLPR